jgi:hypothetical protein
MMISPTDAKRKPRPGRSSCGPQRSCHPAADQQHTQDTGPMTIMIATTITHDPNIDTIVL